MVNRKIFVIHGRLQATKSIDYIADPRITCILKKAWRTEGGKLWAEVRG